MPDSKILQAEGRSAWTIKEFCRTMSISASTLWKLNREGKLRVIKVAGRALVPETERQRLLQGEAV